MKGRTKTIKARIEIDGGVDRDAVSQEDPTLEPPGPRRQPEKGRFCLQVDRQTKAYYATYEAAEQAALVIKSGHPIVRVTIYDTVECVNKIIELP